jgi:hypothetical protein
MLGHMVLQHWSGFHLGRHSLDALPIEEREAMRWVAEATPEASVFLVLSPKFSWEEDYVAEWFPALALRKSVLTPQGSEWLPSAVFARRACLYNRLRWEALGDVGEMEEFTERYYVPFSHVYVSKQAIGPGDLTPIRTSLLDSSNYTVLLDSKGATVLARRSAPELPGVESRGHPIARDCQALSDQSPETQAAWTAAHGDLAPWVWANHHNGELGPRTR